MLLCSHSQKVQAFPGDQDVHADPSCLSLPCLQQLPSHHEVQQVPTLNKDTGINILRCIPFVISFALLVYYTYRGTSSSSRANSSRGT